MKVYDKAGKELRVGSRVRRSFDGFDGGMDGIVTWAERQVDVTFIPLALATFPTDRSGIRRRRCPDLLLTDTNTKGA